jgi:quercetin dioxygenase-like cupin family protein
VPHWGYVIEGLFTVHFSDGHEETIGAGQLFYMQPHHDRLTTDAGVLLAEFSPADELFENVAAAMQSAG